MDEQNNQAGQETSLVSKISGIYFEPEKTFLSLREYPSWFVPFIISLVITAVAAFLTYDYQVEIQRELIMHSEKIPEAMKDKQLEAFDNPGFFQSPPFAAIMGVIMDVIYFVFTTLALLVLGNFIMGGVSTFKNIFCMVSWAGLIGILEIIVKTIIMLIKGSIHAYTSLALLMDSNHFRELSFQILNVFDIFTIWKLVVFTIGFMVFYKFSRNKAITGMVILFIIYTALKIGWFQLTMSFV